MQWRSNQRSRACLGWTRGVQRNQQCGGTDLPVQMLLASRLRKTRKKDDADPSTCLLDDLDHDNEQLSVSEPEAVVWCRGYHLHVVSRSEVVRSK